MNQAVFHFFLHENHHATPDGDQNQVNHNAGAENVFGGRPRLKRLQASVVARDDDEKSDGAGQHVENQEDRRTIQAAVYLIEHFGGLRIVVYSRQNLHKL